MSSFDVIFVETGLQKSFETWPNRIIFSQDNDDSYGTGMQFNIIFVGIGLLKYLET